MRRIDQLLSSLGYCSRSEAKGWVRDGRVTIGGRPARETSDKAEPSAVRIDGEPPDHPEGLLILMNKPAGVVCSHSPGEGRRVYDLLPERWRRRNPLVTTVGRLDADTTGVLLLTDQAQLVHRLTSPRHGVSKVYLARLHRGAGPAESEAIAAAFASGQLMLDGEKDPCLPAPLRWTGPAEAELTLQEGRYHQVKRMFASRGLTVVALHRLRFGLLDTAGLEPGGWTVLPPGTPIC
jgi:16S rRNA pseudouridine516 synthase